MASGEDGAVLPQESRAGPLRVCGARSQSPSLSSVTALGSAPGPSCAGRLPVREGPVPLISRAPLSLVACILLFLLEPDQEHRAPLGRAHGPGSASVQGRRLQARVRGPGVCKLNPAGPVPRPPHRPQDRTGPHNESGPFCPCCPRGLTEAGVGALYAPAPALPLWPLHALVSHAQSGRDPPGFTGPVCTARASPVPWLRVWRAGCGDDTSRTACSLPGVLRRECGSGARGEGRAEAPFSGPGGTQRQAGWGDGDLKEPEGWRLCLNGKGFRHS